ncbi:lysylphosphatidylglycerol synthase transmembrane domain-containing protein [Ethanoligenens sp.]|uniref:lysylphosphatidylglycerol synthase transmembrane domain-containing protein n=1 Tax=Ethanoligenens sp. TaxID=2099655 RepID=UPI0039EB3972
MKKKMGIKIAVGLAITTVMIYMAARALGGFDPRMLFSSNVNWWLFLSAVLLFVGGQFFRVFVYPYGIDRKLSFGISCRIVLVGNMANLLLPLRAGEGLRFAFFPPRYSAPRRTRLLMMPGGTDVVVILLLSMLAVPLAAGNMHPSTVHMLKMAGIILAVLAVAVVVVGLLVGRFRRMIHRYCTLGFARTVGWVFCSWVLLLISSWVGLLAFQLPPAEAIRMAFAVFATSNIIMFIPSSPGGLGVFEYAVVLSLHFFGVPEPTAIPIALLLHLVQYAALLPLGTVAYLTGLHLQRHAATALHKSV